MFILILIRFISFGKLLKELVTNLRYGLLASLSLFLLHDHNSFDELGNCKEYFHLKLIFSPFFCPRETVLKHSN